MSFEEDTYDTIFKAMQHPLRRRILRMIGEKPATYTEIQRELNIDNGLLNYHLDALSSLITKNPEEKYTLSDFGKATAGLIKGVEEPSKAVITASTPSFVKWLSVILAVALIISGVGLIELNNRNLELSSQNRQLNMEGLSLKFQLQATKDEAERLNATLILTQKQPLVEAALNNLLTGNVNVNDTMKWMWILDSEEARSVDMPSSMLGVDIRLVSQEDVKMMTTKTNGTSVYSLDGVSLRDSTHGVVKFSHRYVYNVAGVPSVYSVQSTTYYLERRAGSWIISGGEVGFGDYFRAIPLFE